MKANYSYSGMYPKKINQLVRDYYTDYYRDQLALPDWEYRVAARLSEHESVMPFITQIETWFNEHFSGNKKVLVVGGGTGREFVALTRRGCDTYAVEPSSEATRIGLLKARYLKIAPFRFMRGNAEALPFANDTFDFVWCVAVLEHVHDVETSIQEMVRVTRPLGRIFIVTYDYRQFYEPHYKLTVPLFLPKWILRLYLRLKGRPPEFLNTLQFVNQNILQNIFQVCPVTAFQILHRWPRPVRIGTRAWFIQLMERFLGIQQKQWWILQKLDDPSMG